MCAARVNDKEPIRCTVDPNPILLQVFFVDTERIIGWVPNLEDGSRLKEHTRQEETKERDEPCRKKSSHAAPNKSAAPPVRGGVRRPDGRHAGCGCCFRSPHCRSADVLSRVAPVSRLSCGRDERLLSSLAFCLHVFHRRFVWHRITLFHVWSEPPHLSHKNPLSRTPRRSRRRHRSPRRQASSNLSLEFALTSDRKSTRL